MMKMIKTGIVLALLALLTGGCAQRAVGEDAGWMTDYDAAQKQAAAQDKYVLMNFSGSDWCGWCIKLDEEVFAQDEFIAYAQDNLILVSVDFPNSTPQSAEQKAANQALVERFGVQGFPTVLILNPQGEVVERTGYQAGRAKAYVEMIQSAISK